MPGIAPLAATGPVIRLGDLHVEVRGRSLRDECAIEAQLLYLRGDVGKLIYQCVQSVSDAVREDLAKDLIQIIRFGYSGATFSDTSKWLSSFEGRLFCLYLAVRHSNLDYGRVVEIACSEIDEHGMAWIEDIEFAIDIASGATIGQGLAEIRKIRHSRAATERDGFQDHAVVFHALQGEPHRKSVSEILDMTNAQLNAMLNKPDDGIDERLIEQRDRNNVLSGQLSQFEFDLMWSKPYAVLAAKFCGKEIDNDRSEAVSAGRWDGNRDRWSEAKVSVARDDYEVGSRRALSTNFEARFSRDNRECFRSWSNERSAASVSAIFDY